MAISEHGQHTSDSIDLIDVVFTAMVTIGLTPEVLQKDHIEGMLSEPWVKAALNDTPTSLTSNELLDLGVFLLGLLTLLLSWFGIHASLRANPIHYDTVWGMLRFVLDVVLVLLYGVILIFFRRLHAVLLLLTIVYFLYVVRDLFKTFEYRSKFWSTEAIKENSVGWLASHHWNKSSWLTWIVGVLVTFQRQLI